MRPRLKGSLADRLAARSERVESGCLEWRGYVMPNGYGTISFEGTRLYVHRAAWIAGRGRIPDEMYVCHRCDNRVCIDPDHLFVGTHLDNVRDMDRKGRRRFVIHPGTSNWSAKLTEEQVKLIRAASGTLKEIAAHFPVTLSAVARIRSGKTWSHIPRAEVSA